MLLTQLSHEAHVWAVRPGSIQDRATIDVCMDLLSDRERQQYRRFRFPDDSHHYLISHALVRYALSKYTDISPRDWVFSESDHGRPEVANPGLPPIRFNLSHTRGLAACVVTLSRDCGIDVEKIHARHNPVGVAKRMFSEDEYGQMQRLTGHEQLEYFFTRWTLREAYVKARGIGISFPTHKLNFTVESDSDINIDFDPDIRTDAGDWLFQLLPVSTGHITAVAIRREGAENIITRLLGNDFSPFIHG
ncbi:MAG: 4'-phosphopantetheinyl transferase superfamily protein [Deltaproteobacteria bacterium]|nr:4'-phosphopantetheinyl transferase superfamily protein [Deltaproteobacteria bacterium]